MDFNLNMVELFGWENGVRLISWLAGVFIFWRLNKSDLNPNQLYKIISIMFVGALLSQFAAGVFNLPAILIILYLWIFIVILTFKKLEVDRWPVLDSLVTPFILVIGTDQLLKVISNTNEISVIVLALLVLFALVIFPWARKSYRVLTWYPSGKKGFVFLLFMLYWLTISLLVAFWDNTTLYLPKLILSLGLVGVGIFYYRQSSCSWRGMIKELINNFEKRKK